MNFTAEQLTAALSRAAACGATGPTPGQLHRARSRAWVECLAEQLRAVAGDGPDLRVFTKHDPANRDDFGLNELLYDVCVCRTAVLDVPGVPARRYVTGAVWQAESEFAHDLTEAVKDFNKLVIGSAENKLFVGPRLSEAEQARWIAALLPVARRCEGNVYFAAVTHPGQWEQSGGPAVSLWRLADGAWIVSDRERGAL